jgi:small subunit ribosomal protein S20
MPHHKSTKKRLRQSLIARLRNRGYRTVLRSTLKSVTEDESTVRAGVSATDLAVKRNIIHPNKAARLKSRMMKRMNSASA